MSLTVVTTGDVDAIVPVTGTRQWIATMNWPVREPWRAWFGSDGLVGGFVTYYNNAITFATVRGAGTVYMSCIRYLTTLLLQATWCPRSSRIVHSTCSATSLLTGS